MVNCPACGKWFASEFQMKGHLRLKTDNLHVVFTGKKISRKPKRKLSENPLKQTDSALWEAISRMEAKFDEWNKTQQQPAMKTDIPIASSNLPRLFDNELLERITRMEMKLDMLHKQQQQLSIKTDTPVAPQPKKMKWWEYTNTDKNLKSRSVFAPSDEYLNSLVESGYSPEYVRSRALGKYYESSSDKNEV